jgi:hypothetical protein
MGLWRHSFGLSWFVMICIYIKRVDKTCSSRAPNTNKWNVHMATSCWWVESYDVDIVSDGLIVVYVYTKVRLLLLLAFRFLVSRRYVLLMEWLKKSIPPDSTRRDKTTTRRETGIWFWPLSIRSSSWLLLLLLLLFQHVQLRYIGYTPFWSDSWLALVGL